MKTKSDLRWELAILLSNRSDERFTALEIEKISKFLCMQEIDLHWINFIVLLLFFGIVLWTSFY